MSEPLEEIPTYLNYFVQFFNDDVIDQNWSIPIFVVPRSQENPLQQTDGK